MTCGFCGSLIDEVKAASLCYGCHSSKGCKGIRCPYCYYENFPEPLWITKVGSWLAWLVDSFRSQKKIKSETPATDSHFTLSHLPRHCLAKVTRVHCDDSQKLRRIAALGAVPGTDLVLTQKYPSLVLKIGFSKFSIDEELASCIFVKPIRAA